MLHPRLSCFPLLIGSIAALGLPSVVLAQAQSEGPYALRVLDGQSDLGEFLAVSRGLSTDTWQGFHYVANEQSLFTGSCATTCNPETRLTSGADRGRHVSAAARTAINSRAIAAFYNASSGDLEAVDCANANCSSAILRVLDTNGDVGAGTATAVDPATGLPYIAYYDAGNGDLRLYRCTADTCATGNSILVDGSGDRGRNPAIAFANGTLSIVYDDTSTGEVRAATASAPYNAFTNVLLGGGTDATLALTPDSRLDIVYTDALQSLARRRCATPSCGLLEFPASPSAAVASGIAPSATVLPNGNLFIAHRNGNTGDQLGTVCNDFDCSNPTRLTLQPGPGMGQTSVALAFSSGRALAVFRDAPQSDLRSAQCTSVACTTILRRIASNGIVAFSPDVAVRPDGRAVAIWTRLRAPRIALCNDTLCSNPIIRNPGAANSDGSRPSIAVRPDGRPFAYYSFVGGTAAWDCADSDCSSGTLRQVSGAGNFTSDFSELALRADGRPVMLYRRGNTNDVFVFSCADINCTSGTERLIADEPTTQSTQVAGLALAIGTDGRPLVAYNLSNQPTPGNFAGALRLARCADAECTSASVRSLNTSQGFFSVPLAVRSDNRPVLIELAGNDRNLLTCDNPDCSGAARTMLPNPFDNVGRLALRSGNLPVFSSGTLNVGGFWSCGDAACSAPEQTITIRDNGSNQRGFSGPLALNASGQPVLVFGEQELADVWLSVPLPDAVFANGFE